jgi:hypothetical protein
LCFWTKTCFSTKIPNIFLSRSPSQKVGLEHQNDTIDWLWDFFCFSGFTGVNLIEPCFSRQKYPFYPCQNRVPRIWGGVCKSPNG